jgi:hypothetical protein
LRRGTPHVTQQREEAGRTDAKGGAPLQDLAPVEASRQGIANEVLSPLQKIDPILVHRCLLTRNHAENR